MIYFQQKNPFPSNGGFARVEKEQVISSTSKNEDRISLINIIKNSKEYRDDALFPSLPEWPHYSLARHIRQAQHPKRVEQGKDTDELMFAGRAIRSGEIYTGP